MTTENSSTCDDKLFKLNAFLVKNQEEEYLSSELYSEAFRVSSELFPNCLENVLLFLRAAVVDKPFDQPIPVETIRTLIELLHENGNIAEARDLALEFILTAEFPETENLIQLLDKINSAKAIPVFVFAIDQAIHENYRFTDDVVDIAIQFLRFHKVHEAWDIVKKLPRSEGRKYLRSIADFIVSLDLVEERFVLFEILSFSYDPNAMKMIAKAIAKWGLDDIKPQLLDLVEEEWMQNIDYAEVREVIHRFVN